jgi:phosphatidylglycerophosphatase A
MFDNPRVIENFATFFKMGKVPYFKGTFGTLGAIPFIFVFGLFGLYTYVGLVFGFCLFALYICDAYEMQAQNHDSPEVVIDEVAGYMVTMIWLPHTWQSFLYAFLLFRVLDIVKPWPISVLNDRVKGGWGVLVDDIVAGVIANLVMQFIFTQTDWLGVKWIP